MINHRSDNTDENFIWIPQQEPIYRVRASLQGGRTDTINRFLLRLVASPDYFVKQHNRVPTEVESVSLLKPPYLQSTINDLTP